MGNKGATAIGAGVLLVTLIRALLIIAIVLGGAYALTTYVTMPGIVDTLIWIGAGGYALLCIIGVAITLGALATITSTTTRSRLR